MDYKEKSIEHLMSSKKETLNNFMLEFFDFNSLMKAGLFTKEMKGDYEAQAKRICEFFGYETIYEYGKSTFRGHISYPRVGKHKYDPFITEIKSIWED